MDITDKEQAKLLRETMESLTQASGGATQLIHHLRHPGFINIRMAIDLTNDAMKKLVDHEVSRTIFFNR